MVESSRRPSAGGVARHERPGRCSTSQCAAARRSKEPEDGHQGWGRVRCSRRAKPQGDRTHLTRRIGEVRLRDNLSGTRGSASSWCSPSRAADGGTVGGSCWLSSSRWFWARWRSSRLRPRTGFDSAGGAHLTRASSVPVASSRQLCFKRP